MAGTPWYTGWPPSNCATGIPFSMCEIAAAGAYRTCLRPRGQASHADSGIKESVPSSDDAGSQAETHRGCGRLWDPAGPQAACYPLRLSTGPIPLPPWTGTPPVSLHRSLSIITTIVIIVIIIIFTIIIVAAIAIIIFVFWFAFSTP